MNKKFMNKKFKAVVFDMDGVLTDTEKVYRICWYKNGASIGIPEDEMLGICEKIAGGTKKTNARVFKNIMGEDFDYPAFREITLDLFDEYINEHGIELKDGVVETLDFLKANAIKIAVATSTDRVKAMDRLKRTNIIDYFDEIICGDEIEKGKPFPDIYLKACEKLGVESECAVGVEDSINGVISSSDAGLHTVMVVDLIKPNEITEEKADETCYNIKEIMHLFEGPCI